jgi:hypothetical protein
MELSLPTSLSLLKRERESERARERERETFADDEFVERACAEGRALSATGSHIMNRGTPGAGVSKT